ncbi:MAG TPA: nuclease-related domain-containing protein [Nitrosopumilaceae archaeon]|nr:nuclease-related domain-containing protein [Nitrosopumilaceae archaeon]
MAIIYGRAESEKELLKNYPDEVKRIEDIPRMYEHFKAKVNEEERGFFAGIKKWNKQRQVNKFEKNKDNPFHAGARGELQVLDKLSHLTDDYHVLCGVNIALPNYVTYNGRKNLRSAQMDFVVVSKKGVILIEVKNWSTDYYNQNKDLSPHEQVDRAGLVLWIGLKSWRNPRNPRVTKVLLSLRGNIKYEPRYKYVLTSDLNKINYFVENRKEEFSDKDVERIVGRLKGYVTN